MTAKDADGLALALEAIDALDGWKAFPVQPNKKPFKGSRGFLDATDDPDELARMWRPGALPALAVPPGWVVVDLDHPDAGLDLELPVTKAQKTRRGKHLVYRTTEDVRPAVAIADGVDLRGPGSYIVLYEAFWEHGPRRYAEAPPIVYEKSKREALDLASEENEVWGEGERDANLTRAAGKLKNAGLSTNEILAALLKMNEQRCDPPLPRHQVEKVARSSMHWEVAEEPEQLPMPVIRFGKREPSDDNAEPPSDIELWRVLRDVDGSMPPPLLAGRLDPFGQTILFGMGGTGKGVVAADWSARLVREGHRVLVLDFESHADEWRRRVGQFRSMQGAEHALDEIAISEPYRVGLKSLLDPKTLSAVRSMIDEFKATVLVVDSIVAACGSSDSLDSRTAGAYSAAIQSLGMPALHLGHGTKADGQDASYPFGSIFWHNWARVTWGLYAPGEEDEPRKLQMRKSNTSQKGKAESIDWAWIADDLPPKGGLQYGAFKQGALEVAFEVLLEEGKAMSFTDLLSAVQDELPSATKGGLSSSMAKSPRFESKGDGTWDVVRKPTITRKTVSKT